MRIAECSYEDVRHLASAGAREGVSIKPSRNTVWFALYSRNDVVVGCGALLLRPDVVRLKALYVKPQYRGGGWGRELIRVRLEWDPSRPAELCTRTPELWEKRGFERLRRDHKGSWWVRLPARTAAPSAV